MPKEPQDGMEFGKVWQGMAGFINQLPNDQREQIRMSLGNFLHDMKHSLGLINNANELIRRDIQGCPEEHRSAEMIDIIRTGSKQIDEYLNIMVEDCCNIIEVDEEIS
jgi:hypothetical protein